MILHEVAATKKNNRCVRLTCQKKQTTKMASNSPVPPSGNGYEEWANIGEKNSSDSGSQNSSSWYLVQVCNWLKRTAFWEFLSIKKSIN